MRITYQRKKFSEGTLDVIDQANAILREYESQGFDLTLRQLYYQFVSRDLLENNDRSYKRLGSIVNDARLAGRIDWDHIVDRTRNVRATQHWRDPAHIIGATAYSFKVALWDDQPTYVEVWIEKDALIGVIAGICAEQDVPYFSCRGYTSQSEMWAAAQRIGAKVQQGKRVTILHLGDHDPSGIDMTRDVAERLRDFILHDSIRAGVEDGTLNEDDRAGITAAATDVYRRFNVNRIALTMEQIEQYDPPPNPAKTTDSRAKGPDGYIARYGEESWELDALEPAVLAELIRSHVEEEIDGELWNEAVERQEEGQRLLTKASEEWNRIAEELA